MVKRLNLTLIFPKLKNVDLLKDMGIIPYLLERNHNFNSKIISYNNSKEYSYLDREVKGLKLNFIDKKPLSIYRYLYKNYKEIDVLMLVHISTKTIYLTLLYKFLKPDGYVYLKADMSDFNYIIWGKRFFLVQLKRNFLYKQFIKKVDLVSYENIKSEQFLKDIPQNKKLYLPNGFLSDISKLLKVKREPFKDKENTILFSARHGSYQKNSELLLNALKKIDNIYDWKIIFVGSMTDKFKIEKDKFLRDFPYFKDRVIFLGNIENKQELYMYYSRSKVNILTSRWEGFPLVSLEALYFGSVLLLSDNIFSYIDLTDRGRVGFIFKGDSVDSLKEILVKIFEDRVDLELEYEKSIKLYEDRFKWEDLVAKLNSKIVNTI